MDSVGLDLRLGGTKKRKRRGFWETLRICAERHATRSSGRAGCRVLLKSTWWGSFDDHNRSLMPSVDSRLSLRLELAEIPLIKQPPIRNHRHALQSRSRVRRKNNSSSRPRAEKKRTEGGKKPRFHSLPIHSRTSHEPIGFSKRRSSEGWIDRTSATWIDEERRDEGFKTRVQRHDPTSSFYRSITSIHRVTIARGAGRARRVRVVGWLIGTWVPW